MRPSLFSVNWLVHHLVRKQIHATVRSFGTAQLLLDVGCGSRPYDDILSQIGRSRIGLEVDRVRYAAPSAAPNVWGSATRLPFSDNCFDVVVSFQVLEHVPEPHYVIAEIYRVLAPGGRLVLTAPHIWGVHEEPNDYFRFTGFGLSYLARKAGLEVCDVRAIAGYWVTAGARFCYYLQQFEKLGLSLILRPVYAVVQITALLLDRVHRVESDAWNFILIATKSGSLPGAES